MDSDLRELITARAKLDLEDRRDAAAREIRRIAEEATSRGAFHSSARVVMVNGVVARETRVRSSLVWNTCARALSATGTRLTKELAEELKGLVHGLVTGESRDLVEHLKKASESVRMSGPVTEAGALFEAAFQRIDSEIDFAVVAANRPAAESGPVSTVTIYQTQGIVQTGPGSNANLTIHIDQEERQQILSALVALADAFETDVALAPEEKSQAIELVKDAQLEVQKEKPNRLKLRGAMSGLASTVQTLASAPQAYELLKAAGALVGLQLP